MYLVHVAELSVHMEPPITFGVKDTMQLQLYDISRLAYLDVDCYLVIIQHTSTTNTASQSYARSWLSYWCRLTR